jgi:RecB family exonuclease
MDATELYAAAGRLDGHEEILRARARLLALHGERVRWQSPAARAFRTRLDAVVTELAGAAAATAALSERLRIHAARVSDAP